MAAEISRSFAQSWISELILLRMANYIPRCQA